MQISNTRDSLVPSFNTNITEAVLYRSKNQTESNVTAKVFRRTVAIEKHKDWSVFFFFKPVKV